MTSGREKDPGHAAAEPKLFLSYSHADEAWAIRIVEALKQAGFDVWWDHLIHGGASFRPTIEAALESADCVVVLWSANSVESDWVRDEAESGAGRGRLVPLSIDGTVAPLGLRQIQITDLSNWDGDPSSEVIDSIVAAIEKLVGTPVQSAAAEVHESNAASTALFNRAAIGHSRRNLLLAGAGLVAVGAGLGAWQLDLLNRVGAAHQDFFASMAVFGFANLTGDDDQSWFSNGLSNELRQVLSRNPRLRVSAPASSNASADRDDFEVAQALGVGSILRGSVQSFGETVRIFAELLQVDGGVVLWSSIYDREFKDVLAVQSEIAETVALSLVQLIAGEESAEESIQAQMMVAGTENVRAYEAYLRGQSFVALSAGEESDRSALAQFEAAIELDSTYAAAYASRANMLAAIANVTTAPDEVDSLFAESILAAERSIVLAPNLVDGHLALGYVRYYGQIDRAGAYTHYRRALELAPGDARTLASVAIFYAYGQQQALATEIIAQVLELDPLNPLAFRRAGFVALFADDFEASIAHMEKALEFNPSLASAHYAIGCSRLMIGDLTGAREAFAAEPVKVFSLPGIAITARRLGDAEGAQTAFEQLRSEYGEGALYQQAQVHAQWGENSRAIEMLELAFDEGDPGVLFTVNDPLLDPIRGEAQLDTLVMRLS
jgi:TolB-like protein/Tfp pilus assembly protein PilF